ncbi:MAP kinase kinase Wis1 [Ceratocystis pirilliformis]|uniref:mitogen-activated protein kinase kinase n=1 Tax=Ceratocystis pirilliformis TaxID=259994 RepID=A0ABR3Z3M9_9PEZI
MSDKPNPRETLRRNSSGSETSSDNSDAPPPSDSDFTPIDATPSSPSVLSSSSADNTRRVPSLRRIPESGNSYGSTNPLNLLRTQRQPVASSGMDSLGNDTGLTTNIRVKKLMNSRSPANQSALNLGTGAGPGASAGASEGNIVGGRLGSTGIQAGSPGAGSAPPMNLSLPGRPSGPTQTQSSPLPGKISKTGSLAARRGFGMQMNLGASNMGAASSPASANGPGASDAGLGAANKPIDPRAAFIGSQIDDFREFINPEQGWLNFNGSATLTKEGVHFANGNTYSMSLNEIESLGELGKGNYGTVYKVRHAKPKQPRMGPGLSGSKPFIHHPPTEPGPDGHKFSEDGLSGTIMAMKEIRMELDKAKFKTIAKELMILHQCASPYIIDFYGAFMQDGFVYMCIEYMDGGSIDKLYKDGVPEDVLQHITLATVFGLNELKETHNIIHRDVKPTNILVNTRGQVKICDFGVSGDLVASKAKTNIGCQSYMPPERIYSNPTLETEDDGSYGVQSDIWSLGLSIIECALGKYPYDVNASILVQLNTIVKGEAPKLPEVGYSATAQDFVASCLAKNPTHRPTYTALLRHAWLASVTKPPVIQEEDEGGMENEQSNDSARNKAATETTIDTTVNAMGNMQLGTTSNLGTSLKHIQQPNDELVANWVKRQLQKKVKVKEHSKDRN